MDPVTQVLSALASGVIANTRFSNVTTDSAKKLYSDLRGRVQSKLRVQPQHASLLDSWETNRQEFEPQMRQVLVEIDIESDQETLDMAKKLLKKLEWQTAMLSNYGVTSGGSVGNQMISEYQMVLNGLTTPHGTGSSQVIREGQNK